MVNIKSGQLKVLRASAEELMLHEARLMAINNASGGECVWLKEGEELNN